MKWFNNLKISVKLILGFLIVAFISGIVGFVGIINIRSINQKDIEMYTLNTVPLNDIADAAIAFQKNRVLLRELTIENDNRNITEDVHEINKNDREINGKLAEFEKTLRTDAGFKEINNLKELLTQFTPLREEIIQTAIAGQDAKVLQLIRGDAGKIAAAIEESIQKLITMKVNLARGKSADNTKSANQSLIMMVTFIFLGMFLAIVLGLFIAGAISKPIGKLVAVSERLALGDIGVTVEAPTQDEIGRLMEASAKMIENIREQAMTAEKIAAGDLTVEVKVKSENDLLGIKLKELVEKNSGVLGNINQSA